jgi:(p)ppGpp synthase/HD superfamily hydrolase
MRYKERLDMAALAEPIAAARAFAQAGYRRAGRATENFDHAQEVGRLLAEAGCAEHLVVAGLLHDVLEDTDTTAAEVRADFGGRVAALVEALTEDPDIADYAERKRALRESVRAGGQDAMAIFAADKLARLRAVDRAGDRIDPLKLDHYLSSAALLRESGPASPHVDEVTRRLWIRSAGARPVRQRRRGRSSPETANEPL